MPGHATADTGSGMWSIGTGHRRRGRGIVLVVALAVLSSMAPARAETITLVADEWCPYNCTPGDEKPGFLIEIAKRVFEPHGFSVDYRIVPWARAIRDTRAGRYSGIIGAIRSEAPDFLYPEDTGFHAGTQAFVKSGDAWQYAGPKSLEDATLGVILDYSYGDTADKYIAQHRSDTKRVQLSTGEDALEKNVAKLQQGRVSVVLEDPAVMRYFLDKTEQADAVAVAGVLEDTEVFIAFGPKEPHALEHARMLSDGMRRMRESGEFARILARYGQKPDAAATVATARPVAPIDIGH
jgi:polar amino acid transport system substrate-binding protein